MSSLLVRARPDGCDLNQTSHTSREDESRSVRRLLYSKSPNSFIAQTTPHGGAPKWQNGYHCPYIDDQPRMLRIAGLSLDFSLTLLAPLRAMQYEAGTKARSIGEHACLVTMSILLERTGQFHKKTRVTHATDRL